MRGGRGRISQAAASPSVEGPSLEELISTGIRVDTLKQLLARKEEAEGSATEDLSGDGGKVKQLIALDQVTLRGEDLTSKSTKVNVSVSEIFSFCKYNELYTCT